MLGYELYSVLSNEKEKEEENTMIHRIVTLDNTISKSVKHIVGV